MNDTFDWLPDLTRLSHCDGDWSVYLATIYEHFRNDFVTSKPAYENKRFALKRHPMFDGKEATFWHLISQGSIEDDRLPDMRRCERIRWPRPIIEAIRSDKVRLWRNVRNGNDRILIAVDDFSYVVILDDRDDYVLLWTAYFVEYEHRRRKLAGDYQAWKERCSTNG